MRVLLCGPIIALALSPATAVASSTQIVQTPQPLESGCPKGAGKPPVRGSRCVPVPVSMIQDETSSASGCGQSVFMQVPLIKGIVDYGALWTNINPGATPWLFHASGGRNGSGSGPYGEEYYSTKKVASPGGTIYKVPHGFGAWFVSAGGGPGPCYFPASSAVAWGWTARYAVTGTVTIAGSGGVPAPNIDLRASCPSGGDTTTDGAGDYEFLLDRGACTVAPVLTKGIPTPPQRSLNVTHNLHNVNFAVPCGAVSAAASAAAVVNGARADATSVNAGAAEAAKGCKLVVHITWPGMNAAHRTGLTFQPQDAAKTPDGGPLFALRAHSTSSVAPISCVSGCTLLRITVKAPAKPGSSRLAPDTSATITASVNPLVPTALLAAQSNQGPGYLCTTGPLPRCGLSIPDLKTDPFGVLELVYWAPAVVGDKYPSFTVTAQDQCNQQLCASGHRFGADRETLHLVPNVLATGSFTLTEGQDNLMQAWAEAHGNAQFVLNAYESYKSISAQGIIQALGEYVLGAKVPGPIGWTIAVLQAAYDAYGQAQQVEQDIAAEFMGGFGIPEAGLGAGTMNVCFNCSFSPLIQGPFLDDFANWIATPDGTLYRFAQEIEKYGPTGHTFSASIQITDASRCDQDTASATVDNGDPQAFNPTSSFYSCGPGYFFDASQNTGNGHDDNPPLCSAQRSPNYSAMAGIKGFVYVRFAGYIADANSKPKLLIDDTFVAPYNSFYWMFDRYCLAGGA